MSSAFPKGKQNEDPEQKSYFIHRRITKARQNAQNVAWFLHDPMFLRFVYAQLGFHYILCNSRNRSEEIGVLGTLWYKDIIGMGKQLGT